MSVTLGHPVPDFTAQATNNTTVSLEGLKGQKVVLFFYPKDNTPGCTSEGQAFRDNFADFADSDTLIYGVSKDTLKSHENFKTKHDFTFELISDPDEELCNLFDVIKLKQMYGKEYMGIERSTFLIDSDGILQHEWRKVRIKNHVADVLQAAQMVDTEAVEEPAKVAETVEPAKATETVEPAKASETVDPVKAVEEPVKAVEAVEA